MSLNIPSNAWKNSFDYAKILNMLQYSYNNIIIIIIIIIIIVTNAIILEFLSARFLHPGALLPVYHFLKHVRK